MKKTLLIFLLVTWTIDFTSITCALNDDEVVSEVSLILEKVPLILIAKVIEEESKGFRRMESLLPINKEELGKVKFFDEALLYSEIRLTTIRVEQSIKGPDLAGLTLSFVHKVTPEFLAEKFNIPNPINFFQYQLGDIDDANANRVFAITELVEIGDSGFFKGGSGIFTFDLKFLEARFVNRKIK